MNRKKETVAILFLDVKNYSKLSNDAQFGVFFDQVLPAMAEKLHPHKPFYSNSWGTHLSLSSEIRGLLPALPWTSATSSGIRIGSAWGSRFRWPHESGFMLAAFSSATIRFRVARESRGTTSISLQGLSRWLSQMRSGCPRVPRPC